MRVNGGYAVVNDECDETKKMTTTVTTTPAMRKTLTMTPKMMKFDDD